jgi:hypothetical protein
LAGAVVDFGHSDLFREMQINTRRTRSLRWAVLIELQPVRRWWLLAAIIWIVTLPGWSSQAK